MAHLVLQIPDELVRRLEAIAAGDGKSVEQWAIEVLTSIADKATAPKYRSPAGILRFLRSTPPLDPTIVDELDAAIASGRAEFRPDDVFTR